MEFYLRQINHNNETSLEIPLNKNVVILGRTNFTALGSYTQVSRQHAQLTRKNGKWYVKDLKSLNGVYVNQRKIEVEIPLEIGDHIGLGFHSPETSFVCALTIRNPPIPIKTEPVEVIDLCDDDSPIKHDSNEAPILSTTNYSAQTTKQPNNQVSVSEPSCSYAVKDEIFSGMENIQASNASTLLHSVNKQSHSTSENAHTTFSGDDVLDIKPSFQNKLDEFTTNSHLISLFSNSIPPTSRQPYKNSTIVKHDENKQNAPLNNISQHLVINLDQSEQFHEKKPIVLPSISSAITNIQAHNSLLSKPDIEKQKLDLSVNVNQNEMLTEKQQTPVTLPSILSPYFANQQRSQFSFSGAQKENEMVVNATESPITFSNKISNPKVKLETEEKSVFQSDLKSISVPNEKISRAEPNLKMEKEKVLREPSFLDLTKTLKKCSVRLIRCDSEFFEWPHDVKRCSNDCQDSSDDEINFPAKRKRLNSDDFESDENMFSSVPNQSGNDNKDSTVNQLKNRKKNDESMVTENANEYSGYSQVEEVITISDDDDYFDFSSSQVIIKQEPLDEDYELYDQWQIFGSDDLELDVNTDRNDTILNASDSIACSESVASVREFVQSTNKTSLLTQGKDVRDYFPMSQISEYNDDNSDSNENSATKLLNDNLSTVGENSNKVQSTDKGYESDSSVSSHDDVLVPRPVQQRASFKPVPPKPVPLSKPQNSKNSTRKTLLITPKPMEQRPRSRRGREEWFEEKKAEYEKPSPKPPPVPKCPKKRQSKFIKLRQKNMPPKNSLKHYKIPKKTQAEKKNVSANNPVSPVVKTQDTIKHGTPKKNAPAITRKPGNSSRSAFLTSDVPKPNRMRRNSSNVERREGRNFQHPTSTNFQRNATRDGRDPSLSNNFKSSLSSAHKTSESVLKPLDSERRSYHPPSKALNAANKTLDSTPRALDSAHRAYHGTSTTLDSANRTYSGPTKSILRLGHIPVHMTNRSANYSASAKDNKRVQFDLDPPHNPGHVTNLTTEAVNHSISTKDQNRQLHPNPNAPCLGTKNQNRPLHMYPNDPRLGTQDQNRRLHMNPNDPRLGTKDQNRPLHMNPNDPRLGTKDQNRPLHINPNDPHRTQQTPVFPATDKFLMDSTEENYNSSNFLPKCPSLLLHKVPGIPPRRSSQENHNLGNSRTGGIHDRGNNQNRRTTEVNFTFMIRKIVELNTSWLEEHKKIPGKPPPHVKEGAKKLRLSFLSLDHYVSAFTPMLYLELWEIIYESSLPILADQRRHYQKFYFIVNSSVQLSKMMEYSCEAVVNELSFEPLEGNLVMLDIRGKNQRLHPVFGYITSHQSQEVDASILSKKGWQGLDRTWCQNAKLYKFKVFTKERSITPLIQYLMRGNGICSIRNKLRLADAFQSLAASPLCGIILSPQEEAFRMSQSKLKNSGYFNLDQTIAIESIATEIEKSSSDPKILLLQGPPGTGKTLTVIGLLERLIFQKQRVSSKQRILLTAPSNAAVDELGHRLIELNDRSSGWGNQIKFVRVGLASQISSKMKPFTLDEKAAKLQNSENNLAATKRKDEIKKLVHEISELSERKDVYDVMVKIRQRRDRVEELQKYKEPRSSSWKSKTNVLIDSDIILSTLGSCNQSILTSTFRPNAAHSISCCIVDEATQCTEIDILQTLLFGMSKLVLVGDHQQLPATVNSKLAIDCGFERSMFERFHLFFEKNPNVKKNPILMLTEQFRMHSEICKFPSKHFYNNRLVNSPSIDLKLKGFPLKPYVVYDILCGQEHKSSSSKSNNQEALVIIALCRKLLELRLDISIGIITPYQGQRDLYAKALSQNPGFKSIEINTVDGFQGREKDVIIVSCVRANGNGSVGFLSCEKRLNVAITRARQCLIVCCHVATLRQNRDWQALIDDAMHRNLIHSVTSEKNIPFLFGEMRNKNAL